MAFIRRSVLRVIKQLRNHFLTGILLIIPLAITILILAWLFDTVDNILQPVIVAIAGHRIPGVGFGVMLVLIYVIGVITSNFVGKRLYSYIEQFFFYRIPVVKQLYQGIKQILESFSAAGQTEFLKVVMVEFPRKGIWSIAFITNELTDKTGQKYFHVFIQIMKEEDFFYTDISIEDAFKMVVSAGKFAPKVTDLPEEVKKRLEK